MSANKQTNIKKKEETQNAIQHESKTKIATTAAKKDNCAIIFAEIFAILIVGIIVVGSFYGDMVRLEGFGSQVWVI